MSANGDTYDVAIVGASVAGCTAARLVVAADGRDSKLARWAREPGRVKPPAV